MYINFWYPVALSEEITNDTPYRTQLLCVNLVAFRDQTGAAHVLSDTCIHRGGALGMGKIQGDCVQCPYHGWQFGGDGKCTLIPSQGADDKPPARAKVDSYPVQEKYGMVFAFLGDLPENERPPLWDLPEYEDNAWRPNKMVVFEVDYYYERSVENALDPAHNEFVHPKQGTPGMTQDFKKDPIRIDPIGDWGSGFMSPFVQETPESGLMDEVNTWNAETIYAGSGHFGPNAVVTWLHFSEEKKFHQYFFEAPIDENRTRIFFLNMRHFMMDPKHDQSIVDINMEIAQEDIEVMQKLSPVQTPETLTKELLVATDAPIVRYREMLKDWESKGWRLDIRSFRDQQGGSAMAIPCPGRRTSKNWILDEIPLT